MRSPAMYSVKDIMTDSFVAIGPEATIDEAISLMLEHRVSGLPVVEYPSALHGDLVIPLVGDAMLDDLADFLAEGSP